MDRTNAMLAVIDYKAGNLTSVQGAARRALTRRTDARVVAKYKEVNVMAKQGLLPIETEKRWFWAIDIALCTLQVLFFVKLFAIDRYLSDAHAEVMRVSGDALFGFIASGLGFALAAVTIRKRLRFQIWFAIAGLFTTLGWAFLVIGAGISD